MRGIFLSGGTRKSDVPSMVAKRLAQQNRDDSERPTKRVKSTFVDLENDENGINVDVGYTVELMGKRLKGESNEDLFSALHTIETLRVEIEDLKGNIANLQNAKRAADEEKLREVDRLRLQVERLTEFKRKILQSQNALQKAEQDSVELLQAKERLEARCQDLEAQITELCEQNVQELLSVPAYETSDDGRTIIINIDGKIYTYSIDPITGNVHTKFPLKFNGTYVDVVELEQESIMSTHVYGWMDSLRGQHFGFGTPVCIYKTIQLRLSSLNHQFQAKIKVHASEEYVDNKPSACGSTIYALMKLGAEIIIESIAKILPVVDSYTAELCDRFVRFHNSTYNMKSNFEIRLPNEFSSTCVKIMLVLCHHFKFGLSVPSSSKFVHDNIADKDFQSQLTDMKKRTKALKGGITKYMKDNKLPSNSEKLNAVLSSDLPIVSDGENLRPSLDEYNDLKTKILYKMVAADENSPNKPPKRILDLLTTKSKRYVTDHLIGVPVLQTWCNGQGVFPSADEMLRIIQEQKQKLEGQMVCTVCNARFKTEESLKNHMYIHQASAPKCEICEKVFRSQFELKRHSVVHTGEKPFTCTVCGKSYTAASTLKQHKCKPSEELLKQ